MTGSFAREIGSVLLNFFHRRRDLLHGVALCQQRVLAEPESFVAKFIVLRALVAFRPLGELFRGKNSLVSGRAEGVGDKRFLV